MEKLPRCGSALHTFNWSTRCRHIFQGKGKACSCRAKVREVSRREDGGGGRRNCHWEAATQNINLETLLEMKNNKALNGK